MDLIRIGDKVVSKKRIFGVVDDILNLRSSGLSQVETATRLSLDRTLISRLEGLGELRKGKSIAVIGFPLSNRDELQNALEKEGVDFIFLLAEDERWDYIKKRSGLDLFNDIMELITTVRGFDNIIILGSNKRVEIMEAVLGKEVTGFIIGESPITSNVFVPPDELLKIIRAVKVDGKD
ncbi:MAG TPA: transcriptional regulator [Clostridia bacterium]|nr:transcriptional regulator [Clostridia bacterium]